MWEIFDIDDVLKDEDPLNLDLAVDELFCLLFSETNNLKKLDVSLDINISSNIIYFRALIFKVNKYTSITAK